MYQLWNLFIVCYLCLWQPCGSIYLEDTSNRLIGKLQFMAAEVVKDAILKIAAVQSFKSFYIKMTAFQMGDITYGIRTRYKRMVHLYSVTYNKINQNASFESCVDILVELEGLGREAGNLIRMMEMWEETRIKKKKQKRGSRRMRLSRINEDKIWQSLLESEAADITTSNPHLSNEVSVTNGRGKKKNGKWNYMIPDAFEK